MKIIIVEDEISVALRLMKCIKQCSNLNIDLLKHFQVLDDAEEYIHEHNVDLLFLDLNLNGQDGFNILKDKLSASYQTIVVSANADRAIEAFEYGVLDFIAKPFNQERIQKAISRLTLPAVSQRRYLSIKVTGKIELLELKDIIYIKSDGNYSKVKLINGRELLHEKTLEKLLLILPNQFQRVHKSYIIQIEQINSLIKLPGSLYQLKLNSNELIPLGRTHYSKINHLLSN